MLCFAGLSAVFEAMDVNVISDFEANQLERLPSVGEDVQLQLSGRTMRERVALIHRGMKQFSAELQERSRKHLRRHKGQNSGVVN